MRSESFVVASNVPASSFVYDAAFPPGHILVRPYTPEPIVEVPGCEDRPYEQRTIVLRTRHMAGSHPVVWGWVLAIREADLQRDPALEPGSMIVFKRFANEPLASEAPAAPRYLGHAHSIDIVSIDAVEVAFSPPLVEMAA